MKTDVEELSPTRVKLSVEVPFDELKPSIDKAYREVARQVRIPGFRPGRVPPRIIDQRVGRAPVLEPRPARVDRFDLVDRPDADHAVFEVQSGKGVYMRSLARDLARACGSLGHVAALRRLRVGPFAEAQAIPLDKLLDKSPEADDTAPASPDLLLPVATALADIPALALTEAEVGGLRHGQAISLVALMGRIPAAADPNGGLARAMAGSRVIGLCRLEDGWLKPDRLL